MTTETALQRHESQPATVAQEQPQDAVTRQRVFRPVTNIYETDEAFFIYAEVPGTTADRIDITLEQNVLSINAAVPDRYQSISRFWRNEFAVGNYVRSFRLGENADPESISAEYRDGILMVRVAKTAESRPRRIEVRHA